jgi:hypothetical protein
MLQSATTTSSNEDIALNHAPAIAAATRRGHRSTYSPGGGLLHPVALAAIALLVLNDHVLKAAYGTWWTGKLSDLAGMLFFPLLLQAIVEVGQSASRSSWRPSRAVLVASAAATACVFAAINLFEPVAELYRHGLGGLQWPFRALASLASGAGVPGLAPVKHTLDPSDLIALPTVGLAIWLGWRRGGKEPS